MNKKKRFLIGLLALILGISSTGSSVLAVPEITSGAEEDSITDSSQDLAVEGTGSLGNALASSISEENEKSETRKQSADNMKMRMIFLKLPIFCTSDRKRQMKVEQFRSDICLKNLLTLRFLKYLVSN